MKDKTQDINEVLETAMVFPEEAIGARLILEIIDTLDIETIPSKIVGGGMTYRKRGSEILLSENQIKEIRNKLRLDLQPAIVKAIGKGCSPWLTDLISTGDTVKIFFNQAEAAVEVDGKSYAVYHEGRILTKSK